jgi:phosphoribosylaminoimidazolecarboxamide formyltransferase/IMP cyclohydrolase
MEVTMSAEPATAHEDTASAITVRRALISVYDKTGLAELGAALAAAGVEVISTGGTAARLREAGVRVAEVSDVTGFPECLDGRVKTLHPLVHAGVLADRSKPDHLDQAARLNVGLIDMVVVNLYPFEEAAAREGIERAELIEEIDIGGPTLLRAAAKNGDHVLAVCDPGDYASVIEHLGRGAVPRALARRLAAKVFTHTAAYDAAISARLDEQVREEAGTPRPPALPARMPLGFVRKASLRYGENPHQLGAIYRPAGLPERGLSALNQLQGKELSYNNYLDLDAAYRLANALPDAAAVIVKHLNPCGVGFSEDAAAAYRRALAADPLSAFGGIVALNRPLTRAAAEAMSEIFLEVIVAPSVEPDALAALAGKKNLRVIEAPPGEPPFGVDIRSVCGGWLVQTPDGEAGDTDRRVVTGRAPTEAEARALERAWLVARYAKSNAIAIGAEDGLAGLGCGQTSRVDAVKQAAERARRAEIPGGVRVLASDAFFPFRDGVDAAVEAGVTAIIQPGGSVRDEEVIHAAEEHGMAMVFTGRRCFRH